MFLFDSSYRSLESGILSCVSRELSEILTGLPRN